MQEVILNKQEWLVNFCLEFKRRLYMTVEDSGMDEEELDNHYERYRLTGETIKEQITDYARKYDLTDRDTDPWSI